MRTGIGDLPPDAYEQAGDERLHGLAMYLVHGVLDGMFPVEVARLARRALSHAAASVTYREIGDLAYTCLPEINVPMPGWLTETRVPAQLS